MAGGGMVKRKAARVGKGVPESSVGEGGVLK